jgi:membrane protease YdiL (CAAX protease family)
MDELPGVSPLLSGLVLLALFCHLATLGWLVRRWQTSQTLLEYRPRVPVPWNAFGCLPAILMVALAVLSAFGANGPAEAQASAGDFATQLVAGSLNLLLLVGVVTTLIALLSRADDRDLGLPPSIPGLLGDLRVGLVAWLATFVPVYALQALVVVMWGEQTTHPLIETLQNELRPELFAAAFAAAVIAAPIIEEIVFRLLLQGWLEKSAGGSGAVLISSLMFALAHMAHGPDPVALFFLALVLGGVYYRSHRIIPCMTMHAAFNATSLIGVGLAGNEL